MIREQDLFAVFRRFIIYSMIGWLFETLYCFLTTGVLSNRGFLYGPLCPIYGLTILIMLLICSDKSINLVALFFICALAATAMEFITSIWLEKVFDRGWWNYSDMFMNINGRICLGASLLFGILGVVFVRIIHPTIEGLTNRISDETMVIIERIVLIFFLYDIVLSIRVNII